MVLETRSGTKVIYEIDSDGKIRARVEHDDVKALAMKRKSEEWIRRRSQPYIILTPQTRLNRKRRNPSYQTAQSSANDAMSQPRPVMQQKMDRRSRGGNKESWNSSTMVKIEPAEEMAAQRSEGTVDILNEVMAKVATFMEEALLNEGGIVGVYDATFVQYKFLMKWWYKLIEHGDERMAEEVRLRLSQIREQLFDLDPHTDPENYVPFRIDEDCDDYYGEQEGGKEWLNLVRGERGMSASTSTDSRSWEHLSDEGLKMDDITAEEKAMLEDVKPVFLEPTVFLVPCLEANCDVTLRGSMTKNKFKKGVWNMALSSADLNVSGVDYSFSREVKGSVNFAEADITAEMEEVKADCLERGGGFVT